MSGFFPPPATGGETSHASHTSGNIADNNVVPPEQNINIETLQRERAGFERMQRLQAFATQYEIRSDFLPRLHRLSEFEIIALCDDSGSMSTTSVPVPGIPYFGVTQPTRWTELRNTMSIVVELATILRGGEGVDVHFLNRPPVLRAMSSRDVQVAFDFSPPMGFTPLSRSVKEILNGERGRPGAQRPLLLLIATDGEPTDENGRVDIPTFIRVLKSKAPHVHVAIMACTDDDGAIEYLESVDRNVPKVDVCDDFATERKEIRAVQGPSFAFSYGDYITKALLGPIDPYFDRLDEKKHSGGGCNVM